MMYPRLIPLPNMRSASELVLLASLSVFPADTSGMMVSGFGFLDFFTFGFFGFFAFFGFFFSGTTCMVNFSSFEIPGEFFWYMRSTTSCIPGVSFQDFGFFPIWTSSPSRIQWYSYHFSVPLRVKFILQSLFFL